MTEVESSPAPQKRPTGKLPWSPTGIAVIALLLSPLPAGVLHALNYSRLGRPELKRFALFSNLLTTVVLFVVAVVPPRPNLPFVLVASLFAAAYFYKSQERLFARHRSAGGEKASLLLPVVISILALLILVASLTVVVALRPGARSATTGPALEVPADTAPSPPRR